MSRRSQFMRRRVLQGATVVALLTLWEGLSRNIGSSVVLPPFTAVVMELQALLLSPTLYRDTVVTSYEIGVGVAIGGGTGLMLGALVGKVRSFKEILESPLYYLSAVPKIIVFPLLLLLLGSGPNSKVGSATLASFFPVALATIAAVRSVKEVHIRTAKSLGCNGMRLYLRVFLPATLGDLLSGLRLGTGAAVIAALLAEMAVASHGLGFRVMQYYSQLRIARMYALLLLIFLSAAALNMGVSTAIRYVARYNSPLEKRAFVAQ